MRLVVSIVTLLLLFCSTAWAVDGWVAVGPGASVSNSDGVVSFRYEAGSSPVSLAVLPAAGIPFAEIKALKFEIKTDSPFAIAAVLSEKKPGGGNYAAAIWSNGDTWQPVVLKPEDFILSDGPNDPVDRDGKLDLDRIENAAFVDLSQFLAGMASSEQIYAEPHMGTHLISVRGFELLRDTAPADEPQSAWFGFGGTTFEQRDGAVTVRYRGTGEKWTAFSRGLAPGAPGATHLSLDIQSDGDVQLVISLEEKPSGGKPGSRHNVDFFVPAGTKPDHREVALSASSDAPNAASVHSVAIVDVSGDTALNTLTIRDLKFVVR